jgi:hypothetical protein
MKISATKSDAVQGLLFDVDEFISTRCPTGELNHGRVRTAIGNYFELKTARLVRGRVHKTDCRCDYCPDVSAESKFFEVKAAGNSGQTFIYAGRLEKDFEFSQANELWYVVWRHRVDTSQVETIQQLKQELQRNTLGYALCPFSFIYELCKQKPPTKLNSKYGGSDTNPLYGSGYRIAVSSLKEYWHEQAELL